MSAGTIIWPVKLEMVLPVEGDKLTVNQLWAWEGRARRERVLRSARVRWDMLSVVDELDQDSPRLRDGNRLELHVVNVLA